MVRISELPQAAVELILHNARSRIIPGTNKFSRVCRQWRDAEDEAEPLQLFLHLSHLSEGDLARASSWLSMHGRCMEVLVLDKATLGPCAVDWLAATAPTLRHLSRLEVKEEHSLARLVPVFQQLPQLQHLAAEVSLDWDSKTPTFSVAFHYLPSPLSDDGYLTVPYMQELCPQLTSLHLTLRSTGIGFGCVVEDDLSPLFSPRLQQLQLAGVHHGGHVSARDMTHLTALQQLTLDGVLLGDVWMDELAQGLVALQQLRVYHPQESPCHDSDMLQLAPSITEYEVFLLEEDVICFTSCRQLTRLVLNGALPDGTAAALAAVSGLRELGLLGYMSDSTVEVVEQVAGMAQLRSLQLEGGGDDHDLLASGLAQCTQLTALVLLVGEPYEQSGVGIWAPALQQLTGLQCLTVHEVVVEQAEGAWLAELTQLTRLCVVLYDLDARRAVPYVPQVEDKQQRMQGYRVRACELWQQVWRWPPSLQQVVCWVRDDAYIKHCERPCAGSCRPQPLAAGTSLLGLKARAGLQLAGRAPCAPAPTCQVCGSCRGRLRAGRGTWYRLTGMGELQHCSSVLHLPAQQCCGLCW
jgi:hypothetical protein